MHGTDQHQITNTGCAWGLLLTVSIQYTLIVQLLTNKTPLSSLLLNSIGCVETRCQMNLPAGTHWVSVVSFCPLLAAQEQQVLAFLLLSADRQKTVLTTEPEDNFKIHPWLNCVSIGTFSCWKFKMQDVQYLYSTVETVEVRIKHFPLITFLPNWFENQKNSHLD